jgi:hypothetical protein
MNSYDPAQQCHNGNQSEQQINGKAMTIDSILQSLDCPAQHLSSPCPYSWFMFVYIQTRKTPGELQLLTPA